MSFEISRIANLASLDLRPEEQEVFQNSMDNVLAFVRTIADLDLGDYQPYVRSYDMPTVLREDIPGPTLSQDELSQNAPKVDASFIIVPQVIKK